MKQALADPKRGGEGMVKLFRHRPFCKISLEQGIGDPWCSSLVI